MPAPAPHNRQSVYSNGKRVMKFSERDFFILEFSTRSRILDTVDSSNALVVRTLIIPERFTQPLIISSLEAMSRGTLSPVSALVFKVEEPSVTIPSRGTFSPGCTTMM